MLSQLTSGVNFVPSPVSCNEMFSHKSSCFYYKAFQGRGYLPSVGHVAFSPPLDIVLYWFS